MSGCLHSTERRELAERTQRKQEQEEQQTGPLSNALPSPFFLPADPCDVCTPLPVRVANAVLAEHPSSWCGFLCLQRGTARELVHSPLSMSSSHPCFPFPLSFSPAPSWVSANLGVLLCHGCCSAHRSLGRRTSHVLHVESTALYQTQAQVRNEERAS